MTIQTTEDADADVLVLIKSDGSVVINWPEVEALAKKYHSGFVFPGDKFQEAAWCVALVAARDSALVPSEKGKE
jgi:hypothetical protein